MTYVQHFASQITQAVATKDTAVICQELISVFRQAKTFHQFHEAWLKFEGFKYFKYNQNHLHNSFSVFIENNELQDEKSDNFGLDLYMVFGHDYKIKSAVSNRIDNNQVIESLQTLEGFDLSKYAIQ